MRTVVYFNAWSRFYGRAWLATFFKTSLVQLIRVNNEKAFPSKDILRVSFKFLVFFSLTFEIHFAGLSYGVGNKFVFLDCFPPLCLLSGYAMKKTFAVSAPFFLLVIKCNSRYLSECVAFPGRRQL